jgi:hypothetical protein
MVAQDAREAHALRQRAADAGEAARVAREAQKARMAASGAERLACLKAAMVNAHPDRGGDAAAFIAALRAYRAARR